MQGNEGHAINLSLFQDHIPIGVPVLGLQGGDSEYDVDDGVICQRRPAPHHANKAFKIIKGGWVGKKFGSGS